MTFNYTTLITDRTQSDVDRVKYLAQRIAKGTSTDAERAEYLTDLKGAYNASDLNRVTAAMEYLKRLYGHYGYHVNYTPIYIERKKKSRLPAGYTEVAYIQSSGTQYVDTGFKPDQDTRVVVDVQLTGTPTDHAWIYGTRTAGSVAAYGFFWNIIASKWGATFGTSQVDISDTIGITQKLHIDHNKRALTFNGVNYTFPESTFSCIGTLPLLARNTNGTIATYAAAKLYSCQIYDDGTLVRDYVPCINADNAVGLYDLVNGQFYGNAGTGTFTAGDVVESASESDTEELDPYTWYVSDIPTQAQMQTYLQNVAVLKNKTHEILSYYDAESQYPLPDAPTDMVKLTYQEANDIEQILQSIENQLIYMSNHFYWYYSGEVYAGEI